MKVGNLLTNVFVEVIKEEAKKVFRIYSHCLKMFC